MTGSLLPLEKGDLIEFQYTPTYGNASVYFKVKFYSGNVGEFTERIYNTIVLGDPVTPTAFIILLMMVLMEKPLALLAAKN